MIKREVKKYLKAVFPDAQVTDNQIDPVSSEIVLQVRRGENILVTARTYLYEDVHHNTLSISNLAMDLTTAMCVEIIRRED